MQREIVLILGGDNAIADLVVAKLHGVARLRQSSRSPSLAHHRPLCGAGAV